MQGEHPAVGHEAERRRDHQPAHQDVERLLAAPLPGVHHRHRVLLRRGAAARASWAGSSSARASCGRPTGRSARTASAARSARRRTATPLATSTGCSAASSCAAPGRRRCTPATSRAPSCCRRARTTTASSRPGRRICTVRSASKARFFLVGLRPGTALDVGGTFRPAVQIDPILPVSIDFELTYPDGRRQTANGTGDRFGSFAGPTAWPLDVPGVYRYRLRATWNGFDGRHAGIARRRR